MLKLEKVENAGRGSTIIKPLKEEDRGVIVKAAKGNSLVPGILILRTKLDAAQVMLNCSYVSPPS